jgi:hypothetical protein
MNRRYDNLCDLEKSLLETCLNECKENKCVLRTQLLSDCQQFKEQKLKLYNDKSKSK